jgi:hypothetical protein
MQRTDEFTPRKSTAWLPTGIPASTRRSHAARDSGVISLGWLKWVLTKQLAVDAHRQDHGDPSADPDDLDVPDGAKPRQDLLEAPRRQEQGITARDQDIADPGLALEVFEGAVEIGARRRLLSAHDPPAIAVSAVDRAAVDRVQKRPVRILVEDRGDRAMSLFTERIPELTRREVELSRRRDRLAADRTIGPDAVHQAGVVRRGTDAKQ